MSTAAAWLAAAGVAAAGVGAYMLNQNSQAVDIMARTIWGEARGEGEAGMRAVAHVIANRARVGGWWGSDIVSVCLKPYQFSTWNADDPNRAAVMAVTEADPQFALAVRIAKQVIGGQSVDPTGGATSYYASYIAAPGWASSLTQVATIGGHLFFADPGAVPAQVPGAGDGYFDDLVVWNGS